MGASESKSSGSKSSPGASSVNCEGPVYNAAELANEEEDIETFNQVRKYRFDRVAVWARPLEDKALIEAGRIFAVIPTLGLSEISRATAGNANHWAFIARGTRIGTTDDFVYYVAQFGQGDVIPKVNVRSLRKMIQEKEQLFSGAVVLTLEDAVRQMNVNQNDMNTWIVRPVCDNWQYVYESGKFSNTSDLAWKGCDPMPLQELNYLIYQTDVTGKPYNHLSNNCQHFAANLFDKITGLSTRFFKL